jgi:hydrophobe/amphiphile efflux-3 (HAE3) family protein
MATAAGRPLLVALVVGLLAIAGGALALRLEPSAATDTLVGRSTESFKATDDLHRKFGDDAVIVLVREPLQYLTLTSDLQRVLGLEGCISGNLPRGQNAPGGPRGPCAELARTKPVKVVFGPGTFLNEAVGQIADQFSAQARAKAQQAERAARAARELARKRGYSKEQIKRVGDQARELVNAEFTRDIIQLALRYGLGINARPQLNNPEFVSKIVFDSSKPPGTPKARFAYLFPNKSSALIQVRLKADLDEAQRNRAIALIRAAARMRDWQLPNGKGTYAVTGAPVVVADLTNAISDSILLLLLVAALVMAITLAVVFRARLRLLPLAVALAAAGLTFGGLSLAGASLTMASIGVVPVLIGLAVDYAIQLQSRIQEREAVDGDVRAAIDHVAGVGAPTVATAAAATAAGFVVLLLSPVPMVQAFGALLVAGIGLSLLCALTLGTAVLVAAAPGGGLAGRMPGPLRRLAAVAAPSLRGAGELVRDNRASRALVTRGRAAGRGALAAAHVRPGRVLAIGLGIAVLGWALDTQTRVESDVQKLVPQNLDALRDLKALQRSTDVGGEIDVVVSSDELTDPSVVKWMTEYQDGLLKRFGYSAQRGCGRAELCPAFSLPDLFRAGTATQTKEQLTGLLDAVPAYFSQGVITPDRRTATLAFGIRLMPLDRQQAVIDEMRSRLDPPPGVTAELAGLPVLAAEANDKVSSPWRRALTLVAGLIAVALVLFAAFRNWERALVPLVPIALATGWSALVLFSLRIPLNPMSVTLGALVIAISTEFSVLLAERYRQERAAGHAPADALRRTYGSTGAAVLASGTTAIAGFAVLAVSDIRMLRDFGIVTVVDLTVALLGVLVVLPSVLMLAERGELLRLPSRPRLGRPRLPRPRRPRLRRRFRAGRAPAQ